MAVESELETRETRSASSAADRNSRPSEVYLAVVEVTLEDDEVGLGEVQEQIGLRARERSAMRSGFRGANQKNVYSPSSLSAQKV